MKNLSLIHFSDVHLGVTTHGGKDPETGMHTQVQDFLESLDMVVEYTQEVLADLVIFSGDAYHYHNPSPTYVSLFAERIRKISNICPVVLIPGNHDIAASREASAVDVFSRVDIPNVYTTDKPKGFLVPTNAGTVWVACLPWPKRRQYVSSEEVRGLPKTDAKALYMDRVGETIRELANVPPEADFAVLTAHLTVAGCTFGSENRIALGTDAEVFYEQLALPEWDYVALGHIHHFQDLSRGNKDAPPVVYAGNLDRISFIDEGSYKGFVHVSIGEETTYTYIDVDARPMITLRYDITDEAAPEQKLMRLLKKENFHGDEIVRIVVDVDFPTSVNDTEVLSHLEKRVHHVAGIVKNVKQRHKPRLEGVDIQTTSRSEVLRLYFQEQGTDDVDELLNLFEEVSEDVAENS